MSWVSTIFNARGGTASRQLAVQAKLQITATAFVSYYAPDPDMDTPGVIPGIKSPVLVVAGSEDTAIKGLPDKVEPLADGERVKLLVVDGADHFFRDLYSEDIADSVAELLGVD